MKRRQVALLLALCMVLSLGMTACSHTDADTTATQTMNTTTTTAAEPVYKDSAWRGVKSPVTLKVASALHRDGMPIWGEENVSRAIINATGVQLEVVQMGDPDDLLYGSMAETLFEKGMYPDLIVVDQEADIAKLIGSGEVHAIDQLVEEYCPEFWDAFDPMELVNNQSADGHIYAIRTGYRDDAYYSDKNLGISVPRSMVLRSDILETMGAEVPASVESLESLLYTVKEKGEDLGIATPLRMANPLYSPVLDWMGLTQELVWNEEKQRVETPYQNDKWLDYFKLMNRWYNDDVLKLPVYNFNDPMLEGLTDENLMRQIITENFMSPTNGAGTWFAEAYDWHTISGMIFRGGEQTSPFPYYLIQEPLTYQGQMQFAPADNEIGFTTAYDVAVMIGKGNNHERTLLFLQYLASESATKLTKWGLEKEHYILNEEGLLTIPESRAGDQMMLAKGQAEGIQLWGYLYDTNVYMQKLYSPDYYVGNADQMDLRRMRLNAERIYKKHTAENRNPVLHFAELSSMHGFYERYQQIQAIWEQKAYDMVTAEDIDAVEVIWKEMSNEIQLLGLSDIEDTMTGQYLDALKRYQAAGYFVE